MTSRLFTFVGGGQGQWRVVRMASITGESLVDVERLDVVPGDAVPSRPDARWSVRGIISNERYVQREEKAQLAATQQGLGRPEATRAALIPIRKKSEWWSLPQDDRRRILEEQSRHIQIGMGYLPAIARRLHHCRDLSENEPFDFLTWFEFAPADEAEFDKLLAELRATAEWAYVDREVDIRLVRD